MIDQILVAIIHFVCLNFFCLISQIKDEVRGVLNFISYTYDVFGFTFDLKLSTVWKHLVFTQAIILCRRKFDPKYSFYASLSCN